MEKTAEKIVIDKLKAYALMKESEGKIFTVTFRKKDGTYRELNGRLGVKQGVNGKGLKFSPLSRLLIPVYDMSIRQWRMVNLNTMLHLRIDGKEYFIQ